MTDLNQLAAELAERKKKNFVRRERGPQSRLSPENQEKARARAQRLRDHAEAREAVKEMLRPVTIEQAIEEKAANDEFMKGLSVVPLMPPFLMKPEKLLAGVYKAWRSTPHAIRVWKESIETQVENPHHDKCPCRRCER